MKNIALVTFFLMATTAIHAADQETVNRFIDVFEKCAVEVNVKDVFNLDIIYCMAMKLNLIDEEGWLKIAEAKIFVKNLVTGKEKEDKVQKIMDKCFAEVPRQPGDKKKLMKLLKCGQPILHLMDRT